MVDVPEQYKTGLIYETSDDDGRRKWRKFFIGRMIREDGGGSVLDNINYWKSFMLILLAIKYYYVSGICKLYAGPREMGYDGAASIGIYTIRFKNR